MCVVEGEGETRGASLCVLPLSLLFFLSLPFSHSLLSLSLSLSCSRRLLHALRLIVSVSAVLLCPLLVLQRQDLRLFLLLSPFSLFFTSNLPSASPHFPSVPIPPVPPAPPPLCADLNGRGVSPLEAGDGLEQAVVQAKGRPARLCRRHDASRQYRSTQKEARAGAKRSKRRAESEREKREGERGRRGRRGITRARVHS